ncbi:MAG: N-acetylmuramoyl-L-alanine amidase [Acidimicrobiales bacterium]
MIITSPSYHAGRLRPIRLIVLHTAQSPCAIGAARGIATHLANPAVKASCHYAVDPAEVVVQVPEADTAWCAPGANADGVQIEQAGRAEFTAHDWSSGLAELMLRTQVAPLVADICARNQLPAVWLDAAAVAAGALGITDHATVNAAFGGSDHWDCGPDYPRQLVVDMAARILGQPGRVDPPQPPNDQEDTMPTHLTTLDGSWWGCFAGIYRPISGPELTFFQQRGVPTVTHTAAEITTLRTSWGRFA